MGVFFYIISIFILFAILFLFDINAFKSLNDLKFSTGLNLTRFGLLILLVSLSGIPPFTSFLVKIILFTFLYTSGAWMYIILLTIFNLFGMYFYIENVKFNIKLVRGDYILKYKSKPFIAKHLIIFLQFGLFFFIFGFLFLNDFFIFFSNLTMFFYLN